MHNFFYSNGIMLKMTDKKMRHFFINVYLVLWMIFVITTMIVDHRWWSKCWFTPFTKSNSKERDRWWWIIKIHPSYNQINNCFSYKEKVQCDVIFNSFPPASYTIFHLYRWSTTFYFDIVIPPIQKYPSNFGSSNFPP